MSVVEAFDAARDYWLAGWDAIAGWDWITIGLAAVGIGFILLAGFMVWSAMSRERREAIWAWTWPVLALLGFWGAAVTWLRTSPFLDDKIGTYANALVYVGFISCAVIAVMLVLTRRWTILALGMLATMAGIAYFEVTTAAMVKGWVELSPEALDWSNDAIISAWLVGATLAGIGMVQNVVQGGPPIQLSRLRWARASDSRATRLLLIAIMSIATGLAVAAAYVQLQ